LDESASTDESNSMQKKALQAAGEVFLAIALMHASLRRRYLPCPLCPDRGNVNVREGKGVESMHCPAFSGYPHQAHEEWEEWSGQ
jgi:hypothetical protein